MSVIKEVERHIFTNIILVWSLVSSVGLGMVCVWAGVWGLDGGRGLELGSEKGAI